MKQQNTQQPEAVNIEEVMGKSEAFINKYKMQIIAAIVAVIVIVGGSIIYQTYVAEPRAKEAAEAIFKAQAYFAAAEYDKAIDGDEMWASNRSLTSLAAHPRQTSPTHTQALLLHRAAVTRRLSPT